MSIIQYLNKVVIYFFGLANHYRVNTEILEQILGITVINLGRDGPIGLEVTVLIQS